MRHPELALLVLAAGSAAYAEPSSYAEDKQGASDKPTGAEDELPPADPLKELTAKDVRGAPPPGQEHGRADPLDTGDSIARKVGRALLLVPRLPLELVAQPIRGALYVNDRYFDGPNLSPPPGPHDRHIYTRPTVLAETGNGLHFDARLQVENALGHERVLLVAGVGGHYKRLAGIDVEAGRRLTAGLGLRYEIDRDHFYGYGNGSLGSPPTTPIDPLTSDAAVATELRTEIVRVAPFARYHVTGQLAVTATAALVDKQFAVGDTDAGELSLDQAFDVDRVPGFTRGARFLYTELEVAWDTRRSTSVYDVHGQRSTGGLALGFVGRQDGLRAGEPAFYRVGFDLQRLIRLTVGPRVLELRAYGELVTGNRDEVPFSELPRLGGAVMLRGYEPDRFRDRLALLGQVSYLWPASSYLVGSLFADVGRVASGLDDASLGDARLGYGAAVESYTSSGALLRLQVASSLDGGVFGYFSFNPGIDRRSRVKHQ